MDRRDKKTFPDSVIIRHPDQALWKNSFDQDLPALHKKTNQKLAQSFFFFFFLREYYLRVLFTDFIYLTQNVPGTSVIKSSPTSKVTELHILSLTSF